MIADCERGPPAPYPLMFRREEIKIKDILQLEKGPNEREHELGREKGRRRKKIRLR